MKKIIIVVFVIAASVSLCACGAKKPTDSAATKNNVAASSETSDTAKTEPKTEAKTVSKYAGVSYFLESKLNAYEVYAAAHPDFDVAKVVTYVNIGLDNEFYSNTKVIENPADMLVLCNKYNSLPEEYVPSDLVDITAANAAAGGLKLRKEAAEAFDRLCAGAKEAGYSIYGASAYRSYSYQRSLYNNYAASDGAAKADTYSARPGFSEHQTGLAVDVKNATTVYDNFGSTREYQWAKDNIQKYGFIIRYLPSTIDITGYKSEEWHFRYVGVETATAVYNSGSTFDEYCARNLMK